MELCIFDGSKIFQKYAFFHGKMHICLLFRWLQKMHISYFVDFVQKPRVSWNYAFLMAPRFFPEIWNYAFSAASRKAYKYAFSHGKMHILMAPRLVFGQKYAFSAHGKNAYF